MNKQNNNNDYQKNATKGHAGYTPELGNYIYKYGTQDQSDIYVKVTEAIAHYVGKEYGRNADLIKYVVEHEEDPDLDEPADISEDDQKNKLKMFKWQEQMKRYTDKEEGLNTGKKKLYTLIWGQCTQVMKNELEAIKEYETMKSKQDPIQLLKSIKSMTYNFRDQKYLSGSMWQANKALYNTIQHSK